MTDGSCQNKKKKLQIPWDHSYAPKHAYIIMSKLIRDPCVEFQHNYIGIKTAIKLAIEKHIPYKQFYKYG